MKKAEQLICLAPMPEDPVDARLAGLLVPAPHVVPEKKAKKVATGTRKSSRFQVSDDSEAATPPPEDSLSFAYEALGGDDFLDQTLTITNEGAEPVTVEAWARALSRVLDDRAELVRLGRAGRERALALYTDDAMVDAYQHAFVTVMGHGFPGTDQPAATV